MSGRRLHVRSARELFEAVTAGDPELATAALSAVAASPGSALSFGRHGGRDIVDVLAEELERAGPSPRRRMLWSALARFDDPRVGELAAAALEGSGSAAEVAIAAGWFRRRLGSGSPDPETEARLASLLVRAGDAVRAAAVAGLLGEAEGLPPAARVRRAMLGRGAGAPSLPAGGDLPRWLEELDGPLWAEARAHMERCGRAAYDLLLGAWPELPDRSRGWLVDWAARESFGGRCPAPETSPGEEGEGEVAIAALCGRLSAPDWRVRAEAARALAARGTEAVGALEALLDGDPDPPVAAAAAQALLAVRARAT